MSSDPITVAGYARTPMGGFQARGGTRYGASLCISGGEAIAMAFELV